METGEKCKDFIVDKTKEDHLVSSLVALTTRHLWVLYFILFSFSLILLVPKWDHKLPGIHNIHLFTLTSNHCEAHKEREEGNGDKDGMRESGII